MRARSGNLLGFPWRSANNLWVLALPVDEAWDSLFTIPALGNKEKASWEKSATSWRSSSYHLPASQRSERRVRFGPWNPFHCWSVPASLWALVSSLIK